MKSNKAISFLVILTTVFVGTTLAGSIVPRFPFPVENSVSNVGEVSDYTFYFKLDSGINRGGRLEVIFPDQFIEGLGAPTCDFTCSVDSRTVTLIFPEDIHSDTEIQVKIMDIQNPATAGGTGNFILTTFQEDYPVDKNLIFASLGIAGEPADLPQAEVSFKDKASEKAGDDSVYIFQFSANADMEQGTFFTVVFPQAANYQFSGTLSCGAVTINSYKIVGTLKCTAYDEHTVVIEGVEEDIAAGISVGFYLPVKNPPQGGLIDTIDLQVKQKDTSTILHRDNSMAGLTILPGTMKVKQAQGTGVVLAENKMTDYTLTMTTENPVPKNGVIRVSFPAAYLSVEKYIIRSGLRDESDTVPLNVELTGNQIIVTDFEPLVAGAEFQIIARAENPNEAGKTVGVTVESFVDTSYQATIDQGASNAPSIKAFGGSTSDETKIEFEEDFADGTANIVDIDFVPSVAVPSGSKIELMLPEGFSAGAAAGSDCILDYNDEDETADSSACTTSSRTITVTTTVNMTAESKQHLKLVGNSITKPSIGGDYVFDFTIKNGSNTIQSFGKLFTLVGQVLDTAQAANFVEPLSNNTGLATVFQIGFTTPVAIPSGVAPADPNSEAAFTTARGYIEVIFPTQNASDVDLFPVDLGTGLATGGLVGCAAGKGIVASGQLHCAITVPTDPDEQNNVVVTITNFTAVSANQEVVIYFADIIPSVNDTHATVKVDSYQVQFRVRRDLFTLSQLTTYATYEPDLTDTYPTGKFTSSNGVVSSETNITANFALKEISNGDDIGAYANDFIMVAFESGILGYSYIPANGFTCVIAGSASHTCIGFPQNQWVLVKLASDINTSDQTYEFNNLQNPPFTGVDSTIRVYGIREGVMRHSYQFDDFLPDLTPGSINEASVSSSHNEKGYPAADYTISFRNEHEIPEGSTIVITFDPSYGLLMSGDAQRVKFTGLTADDPNKGIQVEIVTNSVSLKSLDYHEANTAIEVKFYGVLNPTPGVNDSQTSGLFQIKTQTDNNLSIDEKVDVAAIDFSTDAYLAGNVAVAIDINPKNVDVNADYKFSLTTDHELDIGSEIEITFPSDYTSLPDDPHCRLEGALQILLNCSTAGRTVSIIIGEAHDEGTIEVHLEGIRNYATAGESGIFTVDVKYNNVAVDRSSREANEAPKVTLVAGPQTITVEELRVDPTNEALESIYKLAFSVPVDILSTYTVEIEFPEEFDNTLGKDIDCDTNFAGIPECSVSNRIVTIKDFDLMGANQNLVVFLDGIVNPNFAEENVTSSFKVAVKSGNELKAYSDDAGQISVTPSPGFTNLHRVLTENTHARMKTAFNFNVTIADAVPSANDGGRIVVEFPDVYQFNNKFPVRCFTNSRFSENPSCTRSGFKVIVEGNTEDFTGSLQLTIQNVFNPVYDIIVGGIAVGAYNGNTGSYIEISHFNLQPTKFTYTFNGPEIKVNNNEVVEIRAGTSSKLLDVKLPDASPCQRNLTLVAFSEDIDTEPSDLTMDVGEILKQMRITASEETVSDKYDITWTKYDDTIPPIYTPLKNIEVRVVSTGDVFVTVDPIGKMPVNGRSLPRFVRLDNPPADELKVILTSPSEFLTVKPSKELLFGANDDAKEFWVEAESGSETGEYELTVSIAGTNKGVFTIKNTKAIFNVEVASTAVVPNVFKSNVASTQRNTAQINIETTKEGILYWQVAYALTPKPEKQELVDGGPSAYYGAASKYGRTTVEPGDLEVSIFVEGLEAEVKYIFYALLVDQNGTRQNDVSSIEFTTAERYPAAAFNLQFTGENLTALSVSEKDTARRTCAELMSLPEFKVRLKDTGTQSSQRRLAEKSLLLGLEVQDSVFNRHLPKPTELVGRLASYDAKLANLEYYHRGYAITAAEVSKTTVDFQGTPSIKSKTYNTITVAASLTGKGVLYMVVQKKLDTEGNERVLTTPTSWQISRKNDAQNGTVKGNSAVYSDVSADGTVAVTNLFPNTVYKVYLVGAADYPGFPNLMADDAVVILEAKTDLAPGTDINFDTTGGNYVTFTSILAALLAAFMFGL